MNKMNFNYRFNATESQSNPESKRAAITCILNFIMQFGWASTSQISEATKLELRRTQMLIKELLSENYLTEHTSKHTKIGCSVYLLTDKSRNYFKHERNLFLQKIDVKYRQAKHRIIANHYAVELEKNGYTTYSEHMIHTNGIEIFSREPDVAATREKELTLIEVSHNKPNAVQTARVVHFLRGFFDLYAYREETKKQDDGLFDTHEVYTKTYKYYRNLASLSSISIGNWKNRKLVLSIFGDKQLEAACVWIATVYLTIKNCESYYAAKYENRENLNILLKNIEFHLVDLTLRPIKTALTAKFNMLELITFSSDESICTKTAKLELPDSLKTSSFSEFWTNTQARENSMKVEHQRIFSRSAYEDHDF